MNFAQRLFAPSRSRRSLRPSNERAAVVGVAPTSRVQGLNRGQVPEWDALNAVQQAYLVNIVVHRCVNLNAQKIGSLPFRASVALPDRPGEVADFKTDAPLAKLLGPPPGGPNPDMSPSALIANAVAQDQVTGRYAWEIEWSGTPGGSKVVALWPLISHYVRPVPAETGNKYFQRFEYTARGREGEQRELSREECFYDWRPSLADIHQAESPLQAARLNIAVAVMQDVFNKAFLENGGIPAYLLVHQAFAEQYERDMFRSQFNNRYGGPRNAGRVMFTEIEEGKANEAMDVKILGTSQRDSQALELYKHELEQIAIALGVPYSKLSATGRTWDNADVEDVTWELETIVPMANRIQDAINIRLAPLIGREVGWFDLSGLKCYREKREQYTSVDPLDAYQRGVITLNETRVAVGEEPIEGGDEYYEAPAPVMPQQVVLPEQDQLGDGSTSELPEEESGRAVSELSESNPLPFVRAESEPHVALPPAASPESEEALLEAEAKQRARVWRSVDAQATTLEYAWQSEFARLFRRQERVVLSSLEGKRGRRAYERAVQGDEEPDPTTVFDVALWAGETSAMAYGLYSSVAALAAARAIDQFDTVVNLTNPLVEEFLRTRANLLAGQVSDTTYRQIQDAMLEGVQAGEGIEKLAQRIKHVFAVAHSGLEGSGGRARRIARTEVISSYNLSTNKIGALLGPDVVGGKEWIATTDSRVRDSHRHADGQEAASDGLFFVGGYRMACPGDTSHGAPSSEVVECRCTVGLISSDEWQRRSARAQWKNVEDVEKELIQLAISMGVAA